LIDDLIYRKKPLYGVIAIAAFVALTCTTTFPSSILFRICSKHIVDYDSYGVVDDSDCCYIVDDIVYSMIVDVVLMMVTDIGIVDVY